MKKFGKCMKCGCKLPIEELERLEWCDGHKGVKGSLHHKLICKDCAGLTKKSEFGRCVACHRCLPLKDLTEVRWSTRSKHLNKLQDRLMCPACIEKAIEPFANKIFPEEDYEEYYKDVPLSKLKVGGTD